MNNKISKIYIENSKFMEFIDELATQITSMNFGADTFTDLPEDECTSQDTVRFTDEAQDFYNDVYDEYETLTNNLLGVYSNTELDNLEDIAKSYRELKLNNTALTAFGMTRRPGKSVGNDPGLNTLINSKASSICIVGKSCIFSYIKY